MCIMNDCIKVVYTIDLMTLTESIEPNIDPVFKVSVFNSYGEIDTIITFSGLKEGNESFTYNEMKEIEEKHIKIIKSSLTIYRDDSIRTIKEKIMYVIKHNNNIGRRDNDTEDMYLFSDIIERINLVELYQVVSSNERKPVGKEVFAQLLNNLNIPVAILDDIPKKDFYDYEDFVKAFETVHPKLPDDDSLNSLSIEKDFKKISVPLGFQFIDYPRDYTFVGNPYTIINTNRTTSYSSNSINSLKPNDNQILLNCGNLINNDIYVCLKTDLLDFTFKKSIFDEEYVLSLYYPNIQFDNDSAAYDYDKNLEKWNIIDSYHRLYEKYNASDVSNKIPYISRGIKQITFKIPSKHKNVLPLESIFKELHASVNVPLISFNPRIKKETILRLHTNKISRNGKKIPFLKEHTISKITRELKKSHTIGFYIVYDPDMNNNKIEIFVELHQTGELKVQSTYPNKPLSVTDWEKIFITYLSPVLLKINFILNKYGYSICEFHNLTNDVEIQDITYVQSLKTDKNISLTNVNGLGDIFTIIGNKTDNEEMTDNNNVEDLTKGVILRFKRVDNFKENDEQTILMIELFKKTTDTGIILSILKDTFRMNEEDAKTRLTNFITDHRYELENIQDSAGFPTLFQWNNQISFNSILNITVSEINSLECIPFLNLYINCILQVNLNPDVSHELLGKKGWSSHIKNQPSVFVNKDVINEVTKPIESKRSNVVPLQFHRAELEEHEEDYIDGLDQIDDINQEEQSSNGDFIDLEEEENSDSIVSDDFIDLEEEEYNESDSSEQTGGVLSDAKLDGQPISFLERLQTREPTLFLSKKDGKYETYSRMCESNLKRQPVILNEEEKKNIDEKHPGSYSHALKYGTDDDKYWYICPRYWCLKTNTSMTEEEVKSGVCGGIIPKGATTIPKGSYVYEFNSGTKQHLDSNGKYIENIPGFLNGESHPSGKCIPCCFKGSWDKPQQQRRRDECIPPPATPQSQTKTSQLTKKTMNPNVDNTKLGDIFYIINQFTYPIPPQRFGFLPISVQKMFQIDVSTIVMKTNNAHISPNKPCLVRYGVENSNNQSFIACFAEIYSYKHNLETCPTIDEMKEILANKISIDDFMSFHNGSLVSVFRETNVEQEKISGDLLFSKMKESKIWKNTLGNKNIKITIEEIENVLQNKDTTVSKNISTKIKHIRSVFSSYQNYISYIKNQNKDIAIDHTFLWDAFTDNNPGLIKGGVNLVILNIPNDDMTDNVEIICPTSSMTNKTFNPNIETVILLKQENFYEPTYLYEERENTIRLIKSFMTNSTIKPIINTLQTINKVTSKYCTSLPSKKINVYNFKKNLDAIEIIKILKNNDYKVQYQLSNYQGKIIGLYVTHYKELYKNNVSDNLGVVIPTYPSSILQITPDIPLKYIDDNDLYNDYSTTIIRLRNIQQNTDNKLLCDPKIKVLEDGLVVGIITETNQFIQLSQPSTLEQTITIDGKEKLETISGSNYVIADKKMNTLHEEDHERTRVIQYISLESQLYLMFRSMIRVSISKYENRNYVKKIQNIIIDQSLLWKEKLNILIEMLKEINKDNIEFQLMNKKMINDLGEKMNGCSLSSITKNSDVNDTNEHPFPFYCVIKDIDKDRLIVPKINLVTGHDNEIMYYGKIADEIVRYERIRLFMFQSKYFLNIPDQPYNINNDEFLVLYSLLTKDYFKDLHIFNVAPQIRNTDYMFAEPASNDLNYSNKFVLKDVESDVENDEINKIQHFCIKEIRDVVGNWKKEFASNAKTTEIIFKNTVICSYSAIIHVLQQGLEGGGEISVQLIRKILWNGYSKYIHNYEKKILDTLKKQGKIDLVDRVRSGVVSFEIMIFSEDYYITDLDIWVISNETQTPIILFNSTNLKGMVDGINWLFLGGGNIYGSLHFIRSPATEISKNETPQYSLITPSFNYVYLKDLKDPIQLIINGNKENVQNAVTLIDFLRVA